LSVGGSQPLLQKTLMWLGFGLCHQLPERSYMAGGLQAPVCARDTGIYVGFVVGFALLALIQRDRPTGLPRAHVWVVMGLLLALMGWDGITSYAGLRNTFNEIRLITGLGVGFSASALVVSMLNDVLWRESSSERVLDPFWRFAAWLAAIPMTWAAVTYVGPRAGIAFILFIAACIPATLTLVNLVIVGMLPRFDRRALAFADIVVPVAIAFGMSIAEVAASAGLRALLIGLAR
jgi:uncharacterized membrane protein